MKMMNKPQIEYTILRMICFKTWCVVFTILLLRPVLLLVFLLGVICVKCNCVCYLELPVKILQPYWRCKFIFFSLENSVLISLMCEKENNIRAFIVRIFLNQSEPTLYWTWRQMSFLSRLGCRTEWYRLVLHNSVKSFTVASTFCTLLFHDILAGVPGFGVHGL